MKLTLIMLFLPMTSAETNDYEVCGLCDIWRGDL